MSGCELVLACVVGAALTLTLFWTLWLATFLFVWCGWCGWWPQMLGLLEASPDLLSACESLADARSIGAFEQ